ncbi:MAG: FtsW/RodA/SpoVE family cell cycle protein [Prevotellaceae bacterium]|jgi:cell division protein FtsW|nr:FtsW/RodA/SpoVE family cell cycle protein [Prevotellaceae bacterium]
MIKSFSQKIKGDKIIWLMIAFLCFSSIPLIYSSIASQKDFMSPLLKQSGLVLISFAAVYFFHRIPVGWYRRLSIPFLIGSVILLILTPFIGVKLHGAIRVISVFGFTFNPADLAKIGIILYLAKIMESEELSTFKEFAWKILAPVAIVFFLILWGSTSAALLFLIVVLIVLFVGEIKTAFLLRAAVIATVAIGLYFADGAVTQVLPRSETALNRVKSFFESDDNDKNEIRKDEQIDYSQMAIATGGILGKGPGHSTQRYVLSQAYSDFIYAIILEEYGIVGGVAILAAYLILLFRAVVIAQSCTRVFSMLIVLGFVLSIVFQAMLNMCVAVGLTPVTGQPLPLVSLGGSSLLAISISLGIVLAVSRASDERNIIEKNKTGEGD